MSGLNQHTKKFKKYFNKIIEKGIIIIEEHGLAEVVWNVNNVGKFTESNLVNDFIFFCFTKSTKSMISIKLLVENNQSIDALMLIRSIFENFLYSQYIIQHPNEINNFVEYPIGKTFSLYSRIRKGMLVDIEYNEVIEEYKEIPIFNIAKEVGESANYTGLYSYLCELTHPNASFIGEYVQGEYFSVSRDDHKYNAIILSLYCYIKFVKLIMDREEFYRKALKSYLPPLTEKIVFQLKEYFNICICEISNKIEQLSIEDTKNKVYLNKLLAFHNAMKEDLTK